MPSPFPGMDPYLEGPEFGGLHSQLIAEFARQLTVVLRPRYVARMETWFSIDSLQGEERLVLGGSEKTVRTYPDVAIVREDFSATVRTATAIMQAPLELQTVMPRHLPQHRLEIRDVAQRRVVTVIELLSASNKRGGGHKQYLKRRSRFLRSSAHLIEIDLLRRGRRRPMRQELPEFPFFVFLSRARRRPNTQAWPIPLRSALPVVPVPLLRGDSDVPLNLQQAFDNVYDQLAYDVSTDYSKSPVIALPAEDAEWAQSRIRAWRGMQAGASQVE